MFPVVIAPGPTPGTAWTAAITLLRPTAVARSAAWRVRRSLLTDSPTLAASLGTSWVAVPDTAIVRSWEIATAGRSSARAATAAVIAPARRSARVGMRFGLPGGMRLDDRNRARHL